MILPNVCHGDLLDCASRSAHTHNSCPVYEINEKQQDISKGGARRQLSHPFQALISNELDSPWLV